MVVRRMQALAQEVWRVAGARSEWHVGDIAWGWYQHPGREHEWEVELWDGAWAWLRKPSNTLDWLVHPDHKGGVLQASVIEWFEGNARAEGPLTTFAFDDDAATLGVLLAAGFARDDGADVLTFNARELADEPQPEVPEGFRLRTVRPDETSLRAELHRVVWNPSRVTDESFATVQRAWPYRHDLDCVVEAPDGRLAAYTLAWYDDANRVGELEPVGTHPDFRRLGLGAAVCRHALARLRGAGADTAIVYSKTEPAQRLYESVGFRPHAFLRTFTKAR